MNKMVVVDWQTHMHAHRRTPNKHILQIAHEEPTVQGISTRVQPPCTSRLVSACRA